MPDDSPKAYIFEARGASFSMVTGRATAALRTPLPDQHPLYEKIGRVAAVSAELEHVLDQMIWDLAKGEHAALSCITGQIAGPFGRFRAIKALCGLRKIAKELTDEINKLDSPIMKTSQKRNRVVHDAWYHEITDNHHISQGQFRSQAHKESDFGYETISDAEMDDIVNEIRAHLETLYPLRQKLIDALSPSQ
jgi:hypothetical protein